ncbi:MAG: hypothetical protein BGO90_12660 [Legionella sp. 40-6]|nr:hypothetical protein [Legionella sp.]OJY36150.1 MAG: hypothetical protein BGO90_12660 [Legionella sp. 40-6]
MLITREPGAENKIQFRIRMTESIYREIDEYCQWAGIRVRDYFIEKACQYIFKNDEDWLEYKKNRDNP